MYKLALEFLEGLEMRQFKAIKSSSELLFGMFYDTGWMNYINTSIFLIRLDSLEGYPGLDAWPRVKFS